MLSAIHLNFVTGITIFLFFNKFTRQEFQQIFIIIILAVTIIIIIIIITEVVSLFAMVE